MSQGKAEINQEAKKKAEINQEAKKKSSQFSNRWRKAGVNISPTHIMSNEGVKNKRERVRAGHTSL